MKRAISLIALGWSAVLLASCATPATTPQVPQAVSASSAAQRRAAFPIQGTYITKQQAEKIARKALHHWCQCDNFRLEGAKLVHGSPPYWNVHFGMMMCDMYVWVNARDGSVMKIRRQC